LAAIRSPMMPRPKKATRIHISSVDWLTIRNDVCNRGQAKSIEHLQAGFRMEGIRSGALSSPQSLSKDSAPGAPPTLSTWVFV
jgi:hypothetical protein